MKIFCESLISEMEAKLRFIHSECQDPAEHAEQAIKVLVVLLEKLKTFFMQHKFENKTEEITFFRDIKPKVASNLIYYNEIYNIAANKPFGSKKVLRKYYAAELRKLEIFFDENSEFYKYYHTGNRCLDTKYFVRRKHDLRLTLDSFYLQADQRFSTSHDYKVAMILANELIKNYVEGKVASLKKNGSAPTCSSAKNLKWTAAKVGLVELIYALHSEGVFNNGAAGLNEIAAGFQTAFNVDVGQFNRTFAEIRARKYMRSKFLTALVQQLLLRMDDGDDNNN